MHRFDTIRQEEQSVIEVVNQLVQDAILKQASDIHIEPNALHTRIRFRCDGILHDVKIIPTMLAVRLVARLKIMANLNIAERRLPQDGHIQWDIKNKINIRVSTCPTLFGEKIVLRILNTQSLCLELNLLGLTNAQTNLFKNKLAQPHGLILVTGPTGSGKTTTLYSALQYIHQKEKNILTIEDPIEIEIPGINQVNINPYIGFDFAAALRAFLRQDPDIIMIGEIRDTATALTAMQAAQTGHLVLSTMHTNSASETMRRLQTMDIPNYQLTNTLSLIVAQRLLRKLCAHCKQPEILPIDAHTHIRTTYRPVGCEHCKQGYQGRIGIFEMLTPNTTIGMQQEQTMLLTDSAQRQLNAGVTSRAELSRVLG